MDRDREGFSLERVLGAVLRRPRAFLFSFAVVGGALAMAALAVPPSYRASVIMTIEPGRYPNDFLRPNVIPSLQTRLGGMQKMLESAPVIEELRKKTGLETGEPGKVSGLLELVGLAQDPIEGWRKAFKFEVLSGLAPSAHKSEEALLVEMQFQNKDAELAARVVNACATKANEENLRFRRAFVEEVVRFLKKGEERAREVAQQREEAWNAFKLSHMDRLPEMEPHIASRLGQLRVRYADLKGMERLGDMRLEQLTSERGLIIAQIALQVQIAHTTGADMGDQSGPTELRRERIRLHHEVERLEDEVKNLEKIWSDKLPQLQLVKDQLERTKARLAEVEKKLQMLGLSIAPGAEPAPPAKPDGPTKMWRLFEDETKPEQPGGLRKLPVTVPGQTPPKLEGEKGPEGEKKPEEKKPEEKPAPLPEKAAPVAAHARVVEVLTGASIDEKTLEKSLDEITYRIVVSNPGYSRIRQIDFAGKELRASLADVVRQREEAAADIKKAESALAAMPEVRQRLEALTRALLEAREDARKLSDQLGNAQKALEVENEGKGEQFRVIEFARPPVRSSGPGRFVFFGMAAVFGAAVALLVAYVRDARALGLPLVPGLDLDLKAAPKPLQPGRAS